MNIPIYALILIQAISIIILAVLHIRLKIRVDNGLSHIVKQRESEHELREDLDNEFSKIRHFMDETDSYFSGIRKGVDSLNTTVGEQDKRIKGLESGIVPEYEAAKKAAEAVNDFSNGISAILGYDPKQAIVDARNEQGESE